MQRIVAFALAVALSPLLATAGTGAGTDGVKVEHHTKGHHHHHHHGKGHHHHGGKAHHAVAKKAAANHTSAAVASAPTKASLPANMPDQEKSILFKLEKLQHSLTHATAKAKKANASDEDCTHKGRILVNGPLPEDFNDCFVSSVSQATRCMPGKVRVLETTKLPDMEGCIVEVVFEGPKDVVEEVQRQASDPDSKLTNGLMREYLLAKDGHSSEPSHGDEAAQAIEVTPAREAEDSEPTPVQEKGLDIDTAMPYGDLEPFGREDTAQELTESSVKESDEMVDQLERAEVAEEKRAVFRALTRLRGAAITSFDGIARSQTSSIDEYNKVHKWRNGHPLHHLADEESDISKWAFPDNADF